MVRSFKWYLVLLAFIVQGAAYGSFKPSSESAAIEKTGRQLTAEELFTQPYRVLKEKHDLKLSLFQRIGLRIAQKKYRKALKKGKDPMKAASEDNKVFGILALTFGILGLIPIVGFFFAITAVVFGAIGLGKSSRKGLSIAGLVLGSVVILVYVVLAVLVAGVGFG